MHLKQLNNITLENITYKLLEYFPEFKKDYFKKWYDTDDLSNKYEVFGILSDYFIEKLIDNNYTPIAKSISEVNWIINFFISVYNVSSEIDNLIMVWFFENLLTEDTVKMGNLLKLLAWNKLLEKEIQKLYYWWYKKNI